MNANPEDNNNNNNNNNDSKKESPDDKQHQSLFIYVVVLLSAIGGFLFGYDTGIMSGAMVFVNEEFGLSSVWQETVVSATVFLAWLFSIVAGPLSDQFGRKAVILVASVVFAAGSVALGAATTRVALVAGRAVLGVAIGLSSTTVPVYITEVSPAAVRGRLTVANTACITGGQFVAALTAGALSGQRPNGWRYMLGLAAVPALIQLAGFLFMPESPRWLIKHGRNEEALAALVAIRGSVLVANKEYLVIKEELGSQVRVQPSQWQVLKKIRGDRHLLKLLMTGCVLMMVAQLSGINTVMYYSATIMQMAGVRDKSAAVWLASITAAVNFVCTFIGMFLVERIGRRKLVIGSDAGVLVSLVVLGGGFQVARFGQETGDCYAILVLVGLVMYLFFFASGLGSMGWTVNSELYPMWARSTCYSIATSVNWAFTFVVSMTFLSLTEAITIHGTFYLYAAVALFGLFYFYFMLPETRGRSLEAADNECSEAHSLAVIASNGDHASQRKHAQTST